MAHTEYVLGTDAAEMNRLKRQHELWKTELLKLWQQAQFKAGHKLLDLGCGPGFTTLDMARWLGPQSEITAVDMAANYIEHLKNQPKESASARIHAVQANLKELNLPGRGNFDAAFCRWLMIFVPEPKAALQKVFEHVKPGGVFALQEYVAYDTMALCPRSLAMEKVVAAIFKSWEDEGGDPNRGRVLPDLLSQVGFQVETITPIAQAVRPQDSLWEWPDEFYRVYLPKLVQKGYLTANDSAEFFRDWQKASRTPGHFFLAPTVVNIIARKAG